MHNIANPISDSSSNPDEEDDDEVAIEATEAELKPWGAAAGSADTHHLSENEDLEGEPEDAETAF